MKRITSNYMIVAIAALLPIYILGCGGGGGGSVGSWMDPAGPPPTLQVTSNASLLNGVSFLGGPVSITFQITGTTNISSTKALVTSTDGSGSTTLPMTAKSGGTYVANFNAPPNLSNTGIDKQYTVIVSAVAAGTAVSSICRFTIPSAGAPPPIPN